ncbi:hypothetical protein ES288_A02G048600v1 [Gossypium darwinii]|uniref:Uncharacterized protein n=1 Tax=Gossypium darwinii TaxID=34276 RepID=A0A5D2HCI6_GOSDA|nr:hypothetical protein ES288_A02G048600v1 [Gossypium darwinii]
MPFRSPLILRLIANAIFHFLQLFLTNYLFVTYMFYFILIVNCMSLMLNCYNFLHKFFFLLEAKKLASQYQKEADKCNSGMDTCEEVREKAEEALSAQMKLITAIWEIRARQKGWREKVAKSNAFPYFI